MNRMPSSRKRQQGAVAIIVGLSIVILVGMLALVVDLGHLYIAKTELQNAADAAALAGAKELVGTKKGVENAVKEAKKFALKNNYDFSKPVVIADDDIWVGNCPDPEPEDEGGCMVKASSVTSDERAADKTFLKVDTSDNPNLGDLDTWFAPVLGLIPGNDFDFDKTRTFGMAVAGRFTTPITPLGVCAIDTTDPQPKWPQYGTTTSDDYRLDYGFAYGVSYNLSAVNKVIGGLTNGAPLYLHPTAQTKEQCAPEQNNANFPVPFMCTGRSAISGSAGSYVYANTGWGGQDIYKSLNTRFNFDSDLNKYDLNASICQPDANIREFDPGVASGWMTVNPLNNEAIDQTVRVGSNENDKGRSLAAWLAKTNVIPFDEIKTGSEANGGCSKQPGPVVDCTNNYGVLWSYARPTKQSGTLIPPGDWNTGVASTSLYPEGPTAYRGDPPVLIYPTTGYDPSGVNLPASPYAQGLATKTGPYYLEGSDGLVGRRVLNLVILNCQDVAKNPGCDGVKVLRVGKFFMQVKAQFAPGQKVEVEFAGLVPEAELSQDIRLYR